MLSTLQHVHDFGIHNTARTTFATFLAIAKKMDTSERSTAKWIVNYVENFDFVSPEDLITLREAFPEATSEIMQIYEMCNIK